MSRQQQLRWLALAAVALVGIPLIASAESNKPKEKGHTSPGQSSPAQVNPSPFVPTVLPFFPTTGQTGKGLRPKGNNGVGNGIDPQPPGNPPVNDGPGNAPGNPGNRGGAPKPKGKNR